MRKLTEGEKQEFFEKQDYGDDEMRALFDYEKSDFIDWFLKNANKYTVDYHLDPKIINNKDILQNQCYGNAAQISNKYSKKNIEGFILNPEYDTFIGHAFNASGEKAEDYTLSKFLKEYIPQIYYGIEIPIDFIKEKNPDFYHKSLLVDYWKNQTKRE